MAMDFETVRFLRFAFAVIFAVVGGAAGIRYGGQFGSVGEFLAPMAGAVVGVMFGWNLVDLIKGRSQKH